eukprot:544586-Pelagomonas_calceolata.AAC.1
MSAGRKSRRRSGFGLKRGNQYHTMIASGRLEVSLDLLGKLRGKRPAPQGLLPRALMIILPAILWRSVFMLEMI